MTFKTQGDLSYLQNILEILDLMESYLNRIQEEDFYGDPLLQDAFIRMLDFVYEASHHVSSDLQATFPDFPWEDLSNLYYRKGTSSYGVDKDEVWAMVQDEIPDLRNYIKHTVDDLKRHSPDTS